MLTNTSLQPGSVVSIFNVGTIKKYIREKGFGFIAVKGHSDMYYFHISHFINRENVDEANIEEGRSVEFVPTKGPQGLRAEKIKLRDMDHVPDANVYANDDDIVDLKVRSSTPPKDLAGSILAQVMSGKRVRLAAIGHGAVAQAVKAVPIASGRVAGNGYIFAVVPSFDVRDIESVDPETQEKIMTERTLTLLQLVKIRPM